MVDLSHERPGNPQHMREGYGSCFVCEDVCYHSILGKCPLPDKHSFTSFQGVNVAASIQTYGSYIPDKRSKSRSMFKRPWALTIGTLASSPGSFPLFKCCCMQHWKHGSGLGTRLCYHPTWHMPCLYVQSKSTWTTSQKWLPKIGFFLTIFSH